MKYCLKIIIINFLTFLVILSLTGGIFGQDPWQEEEPALIDRQPQEEQDIIESDLMEPGEQRVPKPVIPQPPAQKIKPQSEIEYACYFLALLAIITIALVLKRK